MCVWRDLRLPTVENHENTWCTLVGLGKEENGWLFECSEKVKVKTLRVACNKR